MWVLPDEGPRHSGTLPTLPAGAQSESGECAERHVVDAVELWNN